MTERQGYNNYLTRGYTGMPGCSFRIAVTYFFKQKTPGNVNPDQRGGIFPSQPSNPRRPARLCHSGAGTARLRVQNRCDSPLLATDPSVILGVTITWVVHHQFLRHKKALPFL